MNCQSLRGKNSNDDRSPVDYSIEANLVTGLIAKNNAAYHYLVNHYREKLIQFAYGILHNRTDAEDVVQETFRKVLENISAFRRGSKVSTWIYTITRNLCLDMLKRRATRMRTPLAEDTLCGELPLPPDVALLRSRMRSDMRLMIGGAIVLLPLHYKDLIEKLVLGESSTDVLLAQGGNPNSAKTRLYLARRALGNSLDPVVVRELLRCAE